MDSKTQRQLKNLLAHSMIIGIMNYAGDGKAALDSVDLFDEDDREYQDDYINDANRHLSNIRQTGDDFLWLLQADLTDKNHYEMFANLWEIYRNDSLDEARCLVKVENKSKHESWW